MPVDNNLFIFFSSPIDKSILIQSNRQAFGKAVLNANCRHVCCRVVLKSLALQRACLYFKLSLLLHVVGLVKFIEVGFRKGLVYNFFAIARQLLEGLFNLL